MAAKKPTEKSPEVETEAPEAKEPAVKESATERKLRGQLEAALAEIEALKASLKGKTPAGQRPPGKRKPVEVPAKYKGTKRYKVVNGPIYRKGIIEVGSIISLTNEVPGANLIEVDNAGKPVNQDEETE